MSFAKVKATTHVAIATVAGNGTAGYWWMTMARRPRPNWMVPLASGLTQPEDLFIADADNYTIREVNATTHVITTVAGNGTPGYTGDNGAATSANLNAPVAVAFDSAGDMIIADGGNSVIREVFSGAENGHWQSGHNHRLSRRERPFPTAINGSAKRRDRVARFDGSGIHERWRFRSVK